MGCLDAIISNIILGFSLEDSIASAVEILRRYDGYEECLDVLDLAMSLVESGEPSPETVESIGAGWTAEEVLGFGLYCSRVAGDDFKKGVFLTVNCGGDSTGAMTGNILGVLLGRNAIPSNWLEQLELQEEIETIVADLLEKFRGDKKLWKKYPSGQIQLNMLG